MFESRIHDGLTRLFPRINLASPTPSQALPSLSHSLQSSIVPLARAHDPRRMHATGGPANWGEQEEAQAQDRMGWVLISWRGYATLIGVSVGPTFNHLCEVPF